MKIQLLVFYKRREKWGDPNLIGEARVWHRSRKHWGDEDEWSPLSGEPHQFGGEAYVILKIGKVRVAAQAICSPRDRFCYKWGRGLAAYRLLPILSSPWLQEAENFEEIRSTLERWANECPMELRGD
ncbi:hypothetical protein D6833_13925 [Candidatus Parcubacteria bacterium]|nr:MAG: hypothetical protein D6833_13925 [Candidatus Parcubacteria bacterium]